MCHKLYYWVYIKHYTPTADEFFFFREWQSWLNKTMYESRCTHVDFAGLILELQSMNESRTVHMSIYKTSDLNCRWISRARFLFSRSSLSLIRSNLCILLMYILKRQPLSKMQKQCGAVCCSVLQRSLHRIRTSATCWCTLSNVSPSARCRSNVVQYVAEHSVAKKSASNKNFYISLIYILKRQPLSKMHQQCVAVCCCMLQRILHRIRTSASCWHTSSNVRHSLTSLAHARTHARTQTLIHPPTHAFTQSLTHFYGQYI